MSTLPKSYAALKAVLSIMCALLGLGGLFLILGAGTWTVMLIIPSATAVTTLWMLVIFKAFGALALFMSYLLYQAARDPVRYTVIIEGLAYTLILLSALDAYSVIALGFGDVYPAWAIWGRAAVRVALAITLLVLRPRAAMS
jgi:hypothetical protein